jgi:hypothetical protein
MNSCPPEFRTCASRVPVRSFKIFLRTYSIEIDLLLVAAGVTIGIFPCLSALLTDLAVHS